MVGSLLLSLAIMGFGIYLYTQGQKALPIFLVGVGLAFTPWRVIGLLGALVCIAAGAYWLALNGQAGLVQGGLYIACGVLFFVGRLRTPNGL